MAAGRLQRDRHGHDDGDRTRRLPSPADGRSMPKYHEPCRTEWSRGHRVPSSLPVA
jgi:hypothetical protein